VIDSKGTAKELIQTAPDGSRPEQNQLSEATLHALQICCVLVAAGILQDDVPFLLDSKLMTLEAAKGLQNLHSAACKAIRPDAMRLVSGLGVHASMNMRPIAKDWETWNKLDNFGEVVQLNRDPVNQNRSRL
jgi:hypothetical protein